jgi:hypothetical protein
MDSAKRYNKETVAEIVSRPDLSSDGGRAVLSARNTSKRLPLNGRDILFVLMARVTGVAGLKSFHR